MNNTHSNSHKIFYYLLSCLFIHVIFFTSSINTLKPNLPVLLLKLPHIKLPILGCFFWKTQIYCWNISNFSHVCGIIFIRTSNTEKERKTNPIHDKKKYGTLCYMFIHIMMIFVSFKSLILKSRSIHLQTVIMEHKTLHRDFRA